MPYPADVLQSIAAGPPLGFRFGVFFLAGGAIPNPLDIRFKSVSGIGATVSTSPIYQGGQNTFVQHLPERIEHENLVLERGLAVGSLLVAEFNAAMTLFKFAPCNVLVSLLDESGLPISSWTFLTAFPVRWHISNLDADANQVVVETMELAYQRMISVRL